MDEKEQSKLTGPLLASDALERIVSYVLDCSLNGYVMLANPPSEVPVAVTKSELTKRKAEGIIPDVTLIPTARWLAYNLANALDPNDDAAKPYLRFSALSSDPLSAADVTFLGTLVEHNTNFVKADVAAGLNVRSHLPPETFRKRHLVIQQPELTLSSQKYSPADILEWKAPVPGLAPADTPTDAKPVIGSRLNDAYRRRFEAIWKKFMDIGYVLEWDRPGKLTEMFGNQNYTFKQRDIDMLNDSSYALEQRPSRVAGLLLAMGRVMKAHENEYRSSSIAQRVNNSVDCQELCTEMTQFYRDIMLYTPDPYDYRGKDKRKKSDQASTTRR